MPSALRLRSWSSGRRAFLMALLGALALACAAWLWVRHEKSGPLVITLRLGYSSPLSRQYFEQMVLYANCKTGTPDSPLYSHKDPPLTLNEPERKVWSLDPATFAGFSLDLRDRLGILQPWKREVLHTDFDTLVRQSRKVDLTVGGNAANVSFRIGDRKLGEPDFWRHRLVSGFARLLEPDTGPESAHGSGWRLVQSNNIRHDCTCFFALISPGDYRVELLTSGSEVMLAGPLHVPGDSELIQHLEAQVDRP